MAHEILLYGLVYPHEARGLGVDDGLTDQELRDELKAADGDDIHLRINSRGGSADAAFAINTLLSQYQGRTKAMVDGLAASAGTIVMLGCDRVEMADNAALMIHKAHVALFGEFNADDLANVRNELGNYDKRIAGLYANRVGGSTDEWLKNLDGETYYTAEEAKQVGFVESISNTVRVALDFNPKLSKDPPSWLLKRYSEHATIKKPTDQAELAKRARYAVLDSKIREILHTKGP